VYRLLAVDVAATNGGVVLRRTSGLFISRGQASPRAFPAAKYAMQSDASSSSSSASSSSLSSSSSTAGVGVGADVVDTAGVASSQISFFGSISAVNAALASLIYVPSDDYNGVDTVTVSVSDRHIATNTSVPLTTPPTAATALSNEGLGDGDGYAYVTSMFTVDVAAVNDAPRIALPTTTRTHLDCFVDSDAYVLGK
jgi:hypothetical protein